MKGIATLKDIGNSKPEFNLIYSSNEELYDKINELTLSVYELPNYLDWESFLDKERTLYLMDDISYLIEKQINDNFESFREKTYLGADLGAGFSGVLGLSASNTLSKLGINHKIYAVEIEYKTISLLRHFIDKLEFDKTVIPVHSDARTWNPNIKLDLIISETFDSLGLKEDGPEIIKYAKNYLSEGGIAIPDKMEIWGKIYDEFGTEMSEEIFFYKTDFLEKPPKYIEKEAKLFCEGIPSYLELRTLLSSKNLELKNTSSFCPPLELPINNRKRIYDSGEYMFIHIKGNKKNNRVIIKSY